MKEIGIIICNYNKEDYIINCIRSVLTSSVQFFDVYVVDNASTDHSVEKIRNIFGNQVRLIVNTENKGGSGGFNTGIREALKQDYKYLLLFDNDIIIDHYAIEELYQFMENHSEVGMSGSKVYYMDYPDRIWGYGGRLNFDKYIQEDNYKNYTDSNEIPEVLYCDYVAACSLIARTETIKEVGLMPEDNFIYWDDMEWGYRFNQAGYKVAVWGNSKVWHKAGGRSAGNTFIHYYMWRNRLRFFLKVLPLEEREHFAETVLTELFRMLYSVNLKGESNIIRTLIYAFDDAIHGVSGKAAESKILSRPQVKNRVKEALEGMKEVLIKFNKDYEGLGNIIRNIRNFAPDITIIIAVENSETEAEHVKIQFPDCEVVTTYSPKNYDQHLVMCEHIFKVSSSMDRDNYIDSWCNIICSEEDFIYASSFEQSKELFLLCRKDLLTRL